MVSFNNLAVFYCALFSASVELRVSPKWLSGMKRLITINFNRQRFKKQWIALLVADILKLMMGVRVFTCYR
jgi:hypothetical protein